MKKIIINIIVSILIIGIYIINSNYSLYSNYYLKKKITLVNNEEKIITIKNISNRNYIYNFYISDITNNRVYVNNKEISTSYIKDNNSIIYKLVLDKKKSKKLSFKIEGDNVNVDIEKIRYNITLLKHIKKKSSNKEYFIDTDSAKELYKFKNRYKYIGNVPNNYLYFNCKNNSVLSCELYRIIGIVKKNKDEYIKIIKNNRENYDKNNYNIYDRNKYLLKRPNTEMLEIDDYIDSYRKVSSKCIKNIYKCTEKTYLTSSSYELIKDKKEILTISSNGSITKNKRTNMYRPVLYLKKEVIVIGGNGSITKPYIIK